MPHREVNHPYKRLLPTQKKWWSWACRKHSAAPGWRWTITIGAAILAVCLLLNISFLIWALSVQVAVNDKHQDSWTRLVQHGDCKETRNIRIWIHFAINVLSTLILATSTACMQILSAPTRTELDRAHSKGKWVDLGILSLSNLGKVGWHRGLLASILLLTSMPIHLLYNSIVLPLEGVHDSLAIVANSGFSPDQLLGSSELSKLTDPAATDNWGHLPWNSYPSSLRVWNTSEFPDDVSIGDKDSNTAYRLKIGDSLPYPGNDEFAEVIRGFTESSPGFTNTTLSNCSAAFNTSIERNYPHVILVTSMKSEALINSSKITLALGKPLWTCAQDQQKFNDSRTLLSSCYALNHQYPTIYYPNGTRKSANETLTGPNWSVDYCLMSDSLPNICSLVFSTPLMATVICVNVIKLAIMVYTIRFLDFDPLVTIGDAIVSFMARPDETTEAIGAHSEASILDSYRTENSRVLCEGDTSGGRLDRMYESGDGPHLELMHRQQYDEKQKRWASAASNSRWVLAMVLCIALAAAGAAFLGTSIPSDSGTIWKQGFGEPITSLISQSGNGSFLDNILLVNLPQLLISIVYGFYMGLITTMLTARELCDFAQKAKPMRVSPPRRGLQRSTYFLQVPYRYSLPIMVVMALLHWMTSQSFFYVQMSRYSIGGVLQDGNWYNGIGVSPKAMIGMLSCILALVAFPVALGFRKLPSGIPLMNNNSLALSIACHPHPSEPKDGHEKKLAYGLVRSKEGDPEEWSRIGFSAEPVERLKGGEKLQQTRCLSTVFIQDLKSSHSCSMEESTPLLYENLRKRF